MLKLKDCKYIQENDVNYIYSIKRINDGGLDESEELKMRGADDSSVAWTTSLPLRFKEHHQMSDLVMI